MKGLIKINFKEVQSDFYKRFNKEPETARTFSVGATLDIISDRAGFIPLYSLSLSVMTYITIRITDDESFKFQLQNSNVLYQSKAENLTDYREDRTAYNVFCAIANSKGKINGCEILFNFDTEKEEFKILTPLVYLAFSYINERTIPKTYEISHFMPEFDNLNCILAGRKNYILSSQQYNQQYYPFNSVGEKIVIVSTDLKLTLNSAFSENVKKLKNDEPCENNKYTQFVKKRIADFEKIATMTQKELIEKIRLSETEFTDMIKNGDIIKTLMDTSYDTGFARLVTVCEKYNGIAAFVSDENVDEFVSIISKKAEIITGSTVLIFISDTQNSGIELFQS